jgi:hypothetical protein
MSGFRALACALSVAALAGCRITRPGLTAPQSAAEGGAPSAEQAPQAPARSYVCRHATQAPALEGTFEDGSWQGVPWTEDFVVVRRRGPAGSVRTRAKMLWDDAYLYCVVELLEPQAGVQSSAAPPRHDVGLMVAEHPAGGSYDIELVGMGTIIDARFEGRDGARSSDLKWDAKGLRTAVQKSSDGATMRWTAGFALPWSTLAAQPGASGDAPTAPKPGAVWRVDLGRTTWRPQATEEEGAPQPAGFERAAWQPPADPAEPRGWGAVEFAP